MLGRGVTRDRGSIRNSLVMVSSRCTPPSGHGRDRLVTEGGSAVGVATQTMPWTLAELNRLPEDGNKYELVYGELFVTPAPSPSHEEVIAILVHLLVPYVERWKLWRVHTARAVVRALESEVEPDVMVRAIVPATEDWTKLPIPMFIIETAARSTRRRDRGKKKQFYLDLGVPDYWIVDRETRSIQIVRLGHDDAIEREHAVWHPTGADEPFVVDVQAISQAALGDR
jgi:Uma2 family endonuclease